MIPDPNFKSLGIISISLTWLGLLFLIRRWRGNKSMSFSLHAAQTKNGQIYYFFLFLITLPLFYLFILKWYIPAFDLPNAFKYMVTIGVLGHLLAVIVPSVTGYKERIHNFGAYLMALTMLPLSLFIAFAQISALARIVVVLGITYMISTSFLFLFVKQARSNYLYFQAAYIALFHAIILSSTYTQ